jgi:hypothetical protein
MSISPNHVVVAGAKNAGCGPIVKSGRASSCLDAQLDQISIRVWMAVSRRHTGTTERAWSQTIDNDRQHGPHLARPIPFANPRSEQGKTKTKKALYQESIDSAHPLVSHANIKSKKEQTKKTTVPPRSSPCLLLRLLIWQVLFHVAPGFRPAAQDRFVSPQQDAECPRAKHQSYFLSHIHGPFRSKTLIALSER